MNPQIAQQLADRLNKAYWRRDLMKHANERTPSMTPQLSEALRNEIRAALEADGKPFDVNVARRVYDLAIAARDMCVAASSSVKEAIDQIKDTDGPMETLDSPDTPESAMQASETFGGRLIRELLAVVPSLRPKAASEDPKALVHALAEARAKGMHDVAAALEVKLFGRALPHGDNDGEVAVGGDNDGEVAVGGYEQGYADGKIGAGVTSTSDNYREGYKDGTTERYLGPAPADGKVIEGYKDETISRFIEPTKETCAGGHPPEALYDSPYDDGYQVFCRACGKHVRLGRLGSLSPVARSTVHEPEPGYEYQRESKIADVRAYAPSPDAACLLCAHPAGSLHKAGCGSNTSDDELDRLALIARGWIRPDEGAGRNPPRPPSGMENAFDADHSGGMP